MISGPGSVIYCCRPARYASRLVWFKVARTASLLAGAAPPVASTMSASGASFPQNFFIASHPSPAILVLFRQCCVRLTSASSRGVDDFAKLDVSVDVRFHALYFRNRTGRPPPRAAIQTDPLPKFFTEVFAPLFSKSGCFCKPLLTARAIASCKSREVSPLSNYC
jgi:hypothetical protein